MCWNGTIGSLLVPGLARDPVNAFADSLRGTLN